MWFSSLCLMSLCSSLSSSLIVRRTRHPTVGDRAFPVAAARDCCQILSLPHLPKQSFGPGLKLTCLTFPTPVIVQCLRSDSSCYGHYNRSWLLALGVCHSTPYRTICCYWTCSRDIIPPLCIWILTKIAVNTPKEKVDSLTEECFHPVDVAVCLGVRQLAEDGLTVSVFSFHSGFTFNWSFHLKWCNFTYSECFLFLLNINLSHLLNCF